MKNVIIFVKILGEGADSYFPMNSIRQGANLYKITNTQYDENDIFPEFIAGDIVNVEVDIEQKYVAKFKVNNLDRILIYIRDSRKRLYPIPAFAQKIGDEKYRLMPNNYTWSQYANLEFQVGDIVNIKELYYTKFFQKILTAIRLN